MKRTLTGNDLALAQSSVQLAIAWWKPHPASGHKKRQLAQLNALNTKLGALSDYAYPYKPSDMPLNIGDEELMKIDTHVATQTRAAAHRASKKR